jgi:uncharacterized membrane protein YfcA
MTTYVLVCLIILLAGLTKGFSGFGSVLVALPLLSIFMEMKTAVPFMMLCTFSMTVVLLVKLREHLEWKNVIPLFLGAVPGLVVGVIFLKKMDDIFIQAVLGVTLVSYALFGLTFRQTRKTGIGDRWAYFFGFLSGCLESSLSSGGPPAIAYASLKAWSKDTIKVTVLGYLLIVEISTVFLHAVSGLTTATVLRLFAVAAPVMILSTFAGSRLYDRVQDEYYKSAILVILGILGLTMIYRVVRHF